MEGSTSIPVIDVSSFDGRYNELAEEITQACKSWGFFFIKNHPIPQDLIEKLFEMSAKFHALPQAEKNKYPINKDRIGYKGPGDDYRKDEKAVMWLGGPPGFIRGNANTPPFFIEYYDLIDEYKRQCNKLSLQLLQCFSLILGLDKDAFASHHQVDRGSSLVVALHYPAKDSPPPPKSARISPHTDGSSSITILFQKSKGLEVLSPSGKWVQAPAPGFDHALINVGDLLQYWSGNQLKSTLHRVTQEGLPWDKERYSLAFFCGPAPDTCLDPVAGDKEAIMVAQDGKAFAKGMTAADYTRLNMSTIYGPEFYAKQTKAQVV